MPIKVLMPALSPTMVEGTLSKWCKAPGDKIEPGQVIAEIETDKATMEVEATDEGVLGRIFVEAGTENVKVNSLIALILEEGEDASICDTFNVDEAPFAQITAVAPKNDAPRVEQETSSQTVTQTGERIFASPLAKRIAKETNVPLSAIKGTGPHGRIVKQDVESFKNVPESLQVEVSKAENKPALEPSSTIDVQQLNSASLSTQSWTSTQSIGPSSFTDIPLNGMRKIIAKRLTESKQTVPHFYLSVDCNLEPLMMLRAQLNEHLEGTKLSVNDFILKACALSLMKVPQANVSWEQNALRQYHSADVSMAVAIEGGLVTPVIHSAQNRSLKEISIIAKDLAVRARAGKLKPEEYQGGTFTLSNLGMFWIKNFNAIINPPQACILAIGAGQKQAIVEGDSIKIATVMSVTLSVDHRAVDGAVGSSFLKVFKNLLENPLQLVL
ncbi:MAG TPA: pyruvate dehydrogenase complex dihydrolipoamide acetyltransferase [Alphaproteobacteria bacterium]|nr:pyruvate dehydrogenase complex dihydrolipoamide acetyltransferase [Alphaproteobacteria bacterium]